ncbi:MAG: peptidase C39 [Clostridium sp.]|nr:peptidase C39 [Clostridium sp.]
MKIPLQYQRTEYDCGPTSLLNAVSFLMNREEIPPDVLRYVMMYTLDSYNHKGEACKNGTSRMAMLFLSSWLNQYAKATRFPLSCEYLSGDRVRITEDSKVVEALRQGGAAVVRLLYGCEHYVTLTGFSGRRLELFDPYYRRRPFKQEGISILTDKPHSANRSLPFEMLNQTGRLPYALGPEESREAVLLFHTGTRRTPESTIEYFL